MAEENLIQTNIVANANFAPLIGDLNKVSLALTALQEKLNASNKALATQVSVMNKTFAETLRSTGQFSTHFVSLTSDVDKFGSQLDKGQIKLTQFFRTYQDHIKNSGGIIRQLAQQQVQMQNAVLQPLGRNAEGLMQYNVHIPRGLDLIANKSKIAAQELSIMNRFVQEGAGQLINWGKNTQWAGRQLTVGLTVPMMAFGKAAADAFRTADEQLVRLTKVYGGLSQTSQAELQKVRKDVTATAGALAKQYGASFTDTIALAADIAATGKQGNDLLKSTQETTRLSILGEVSRQDAMKATLAIQTAFKQNTTELAGSIDFLNAVENQTSTTLQDLVEAIPKAGPIIKGLGGNIKDLSLYITAMKEGGVSAAEGANALKSALGSLINPTKVATNMFAGFGIDLKGIVTKNAGNLTGTLLELQSALDKLNPLQKQQALEQLFGKFQFARMNALFSNLGKQGSQTLQVLDLMKASSQDLANIASRELSQVTESASGKYRRAVEGLKADLAGIGDQFLSINTQLIKLLDGFIKFAQSLPDPIKKAMSFMGMLTATLGPIIMLTGVLGNFFGYIIKGVYHFKAFFKGAEGWKLLTPEILAANKAGTLAEQTFYSDAKAASILNQSLQTLIASYTTLESRVNTGVISTSATAATAYMAGKGRQVNPASPFISPVDTRSMSHLNPVSGMSSEQKIAQTMFGVVPGAPLVNAKIGGMPQMYMSGDLAKIEGASSVKGVSTGVVAEEAAKWHSMTAALAMQSKAEIAKLKTEVLATGTVTTEVAQAYEMLLPKMNEITANAANASAVIVEDLRLNKITASEAKAKIIALNAEVEQLMVSASQEIAGGLGRTINPTQVPLLNQPVIDPKTGKSNMKELVKKGRTRGLVNSIARALGVKTYGASYSVETTIPKKFAMGDIVPGSGNQDNVPAMLMPGEFVVTKSATQKYLPLLRQINGDGNPGFSNAGGGFFSPKIANAILASFGITSKSKKASRLVGNWGMTIPKLVNDQLAKKRNSPGASGTMLKMLMSQPDRLTDLDAFLKFNGVSDRYAAEIKKTAARNIKSNLASDKFYGDAEFGSIGIGGIEKAIYDFERNLPNMYPGLHTKFQIDRLNPGRRDTASSSKKHGPSPTPINVPGFRKSGYGSGANSPFTGTQVWGHFDDPLFNKNIQMLARQLFAGTGNISPERIAQLTAKWPRTEKFVDFRTPLGVLSNEDPLHGPLHIGVSNLTANKYNKDIAGMTQLVNYYNRGNIGIGGSRPGVSSTYAHAFPVGAAKDQAMYMLQQYMTGMAPGQFMGFPSVKAGLKKLATPFTGKAYRGVSWARGGEASGGLPSWISDLVYEAEQTGDYSKLIGKNFIWQSSSWSKNQDVAKNFSQTFRPGQAGTIFEVDLKNRNVVEASKLFPGITYSGKSNFGGGTSEQEMLFGGAFTIKEAGPGKIVLSTAGGLKKRERGGDVSSNTPYLVGEKGPELFVPGQSGNIIPHMARGGKVMGLAKSTLPTLLLQMFGSQIGGAIGGGLGGSTGREIGSMVGNVAAMASWILPMTALAKKSEQTASSLGKFAGILSKVRLLANPYVAAIATVGTAMLALKKYTDDTYNTQKLAFVGAVKPLESLDKKLEESRKKYDSIRQSAELYAATKTDAGAAGIKITVAELNKLKDSVKKTYPDLVKLLNQTSKTTLQDTVNNLKAQFIQAGDSAAEATKKVYALLLMSDKAKSAGVYVSGAAGITDKNSAMKQQLGALEKLGAGGRDAATFAEVLVSSFSNLDNLSNNVATNFSTLEKSGASNVKLTQNQVDELKKIDPILASNLSKSDSIGEAYKKWRILLSGIAVDLSNISSDKLDKIYAASQGITSYFDSLNTTSSDVAKTDKLFGSIAKQIDSADQAAKSASKALTAYNANGANGLKEQIKLREKQIKQISDEANARKKALQDQQAAEDINLQIQQEKLNYQQALASGDMSAAATSQLAIQRLVKSQQLTMAQNAIDTTAQTKIDSLTAKNEADQAKIDNTQTSLSAASQTSSKTEALRSAYGELTSFLQRVSLSGKPDAKDEIAFQGYLDKIKAAGGDVSKFGKLQDALKNVDVQVGLLSNIQNAVEEMANIMSGRKQVKTETGPYSTPGSQAAGGGTVNSGNQIAPVVGTTLKEAITNRSSQAQGGHVTYNYKGYSTFKWKGKTYAYEDGNPNIAWEWDEAKSSPIGKPINVNKKARGGYISGIGTGTSDSIPAMLSNGEYVVNAMSAAKFGYGNLDKINKMAAGGMVTFDVPKSSSLRLSGGSPGGTWSSNDIINVNINNVSMDNPRQVGRDIAAGIMDIKSGKNNRLISSR